MLSPGEQPGRRKTNSRGLLLAMLAFAAIGAVLLSQKAKLKEYQLYFTADRKPVVFAFDELSDGWTEKSVREKFAAHPVSCHPYRGNLPVERACAVDVESHNGVPTLFISFFFSAGQLKQASINIPWWSHATARTKVTAALGPPTASQLIPREGVRLLGWRLPDGAALFLNRDRPLNPLSWNAIYWRSRSECVRLGCFQNIDS